MPPIVHRNLKTQRGVSLYIAFMIMTVLLGISLGASTLLFSQIGVLKGMGHSVLAFYAVDTGVEIALLADKEAGCSIIVNINARMVCLNTEFQSMGADPQNIRLLTNGSGYNLVAAKTGTPGCPTGQGFIYCIKVNGFYQEARRTVRIAR